MARFPAAPRWRSSPARFSGNSAGDGGGGVYSDGSDGGHALVHIVDSTLSGNTADQIGGGIRHVGTDGDARLEISGSTFADNSAEGGGSIETLGGSTSLEVDSTIFAAGARGVTISNDGGSVTSHGYNLSSDGADGVLSAATDRVDTDPMLGPLQNNGGPTFTHELLTGSPAVDAIPIGDSCSPTDQRRGLPPAGRRVRHRRLRAFERRAHDHQLLAPEGRARRHRDDQRHEVQRRGVRDVRWNPGELHGHLGDADHRHGPPGATTGPIRVGTTLGQ